MAAARDHFDALPDFIADKNLSGNAKQRDHYVLAFYVAGLAVECLFRAYTELVGGRHEDHHDLKRHFDNGGFLGFMPSQEHEAIVANLGEVRTRWLNNHRYKSLASLRRFLNDSELYQLDGNRTIKGGKQQVVEHNWGVLEEAASSLLTAGIRQWEPSKKKWNRS